MVQKVRYNGGTQRMYECSDPTDLIVGKEYEVIQKKESDWHTEYILRGVKGEFNSVWFQKTSIWLFLAENLSQEKYTLALNWSLSVESLN